MEALKTMTWPGALLGSVIAICVAFVVVVLVNKFFS